MKIKRPLTPWGGRITHQVVIFGVEGDAEDRSFVATQRLLVAAVRYLHHLHHEVAAESRETDNNGETGT